MEYNIENTIYKLEEILSKDKRFYKNKDYLFKYHIQQLFNNNLNNSIDITAIIDDANIKYHKKMVKKEKEKETSFLSNIAQLHQIKEIETPNTIVNETQCSVKQLEEIMKIEQNITKILEDIIS